MTGKVLDCRRPAAPDRRDDRRDRRQADRRGELEQSLAVAHRIYAQALLDAAQGAGRPRAVVREEFAEFATALRGRRTSSRRSFATRRSTAGRSGTSSTPCSPARDEAVPELRPPAGGEEPDRRGRRDLRGVRAPARRGGADPRGRAHDRGRAQRQGGRGDRRADRGARRDARSRRRRNVDPALIGGLVLQAGSLRVDASVRGRLDDLREELLQKS